MNIISCLLVVCLSFQILFNGVVGLEENDYRNQFTDWMQFHGKSYTASDFAERYQKFKNTVNIINTHNSKKDSSYELGTNEHSDLSHEEFTAIFLHPIRSIHTLLPANEEVVEETRRVVTRTTSSNWLTSGAVTPVKNQGQCGSCWTFGSTGAVEGAHFLATGSLVSLSEQYLLDCVNASNNGCNGGVPYYALQLVQKTGQPTELSYPYKAAKGPSCIATNPVAATIKGVVSVTPSGSESALLTAVSNGPVTVAIDASHPSFQSYKTGVYNEAACTNCSSCLDHAVLAVGYGTATTGGDYWLIKNSWGTSWGQAGYLWLARNAGNKCGVATSACYPTH